jgi:uncharacterized membrane protein (DUF373 family)
MRRAANLPLKEYVSQMISILLKKFERAVILSLIFLMIVVVLISTFELFYIIVKDIISPPVFWLEINQLLDIFGFILLILIGVELLETIKAYLTEKVVHSEVVLEVALIAITRKVIILDVKEYSGLAIIGIAALIVAIAVAFYFLKKMTKTPSAHQQSGPPK